MNKRNEIKKFITNIECGSCGKHYELGSIDDVRYREDFSFLHMYCPSCDKTDLLIVDVKEYKETKAATDMIEAWESCFSIPVSSSDVLDMHIFLKDFKGGFNA